LAKASPRLGAGGNGWREPSVHRCSQHLGDGQELGAGWDAVEDMEQDLEEDAYPLNDSITGQYASDAAVAVREYISAAAMASVEELSLHCSRPHLRRSAPIRPGARPFRGDAQ